MKLYDMLSAWLFVLLMTVSSLVFGESSKCEPLPNPANGEVDDMNDVAVYSCNSEYWLNGIFIRICDNGSWSGVAPTCDIVDCGPLSDPAHGSVSTPHGTTNHQKAIYTCNTGYALDGISERTCTGGDSAPRWSGSPPQCVFIQCTELRDPPGGKVFTPFGRGINQQAKYTCSARYTLKGDKVRTCKIFLNSYGLWSGSEPTCFLDCGHLYSPTNGAVDTSSGILVGSSATYSCDSGYTLVGSETNYCTSAGTWRDDPPTCKRTDCGLLYSPLHGDVHTLYGTSVGELAHYDCNAGYRLEGSDIRTCMSSGKWSSVEPYCKLRGSAMISSCTSWTTLILALVSMQMLLKM